MATPQEIQKLLDRLDSSFRRLGEDNPFKSFDYTKVESAEAATKQLETALQGVERRLANINEDISGVASAFKQTVDEIKNTNSGLNLAARTFRGLSDIATKLKYDQEGISKLNSKDLIKLQQQARQKREDLKISKDLLATTIDELKEKEKNGKLTAKERKLLTQSLSANNAIKNELKDQDTLSEIINDKLSSRIAQEERIEKSLGISGGLLKGIEGFMNKIGLGALSSAVGFNDINTELREYAEELDESEKGLSEQAKQQKILDKGFGLIGEKVKSALSDPMVVIAIGLKAINALTSALSKGFARSQENTGALAKNLNISNEEAMGLSKNLSAASFGSDALFLSSKGLTETLVEINKELGTSIQFSTEQLATFTKLRETAGLTNEELMGIQKLSLANGQSFDANADSLLNQVSALNRASGIYINEKQVLKDISNLTASTQLSLSKNPEALAEAVTVARALGMEMSKVENIADSLLDFESSITNELQAELLIGRNINLEKARQAALNNDLATLAKEIAEQAGTAAEFSQMNRIQQDAIAKSVGMGREELAQTLFVQEQLAGASGEEAERRQRLLDARIEEVGLAQAQRELEEGGLENMLNQATATEKMQASLGKINELFTALGASFAPIVNMFASFVGMIMESRVAMMALSGIIGGVTLVLGGLAVKSLITAAGQIMASFAQIPFGLGIPVGLATIGALGGIISSFAATAKADDILSEGSGGSGYGKRMLLAPEGAFALNNKDTVIAGTNLFKGDDVISAGAGQVNVAPPDNKTGEQTNRLLSTLIRQNAKKPEMSPMNLYEIS